MFRDALNFPTEGDRGAAALVVGSGLVLLLTVAEWGALLVSPVPGDASLVDQLGVRRETLELTAYALAALAVALRILLRGYYVAVHRAVAGRADPVAPPFRGFRLVTDGVRSAVVLLTYLVPAAALVGLGYGLRTWAGAGSDLTGQVVGTAGALAFLLAIAAFIAAAYLVPGAVTLFAYEDRLLSAFALRRVANGAATEDYAVAWVEGAATQLFLQPFAWLFQLLLVGTFFRFYLNVTVRYLFARGFSDALGLDADAPPAAERAPGRAEGERPRALSGDAPQSALRPEDRWRHERPSATDVDAAAREDDPVAAEFRRRGNE